MKTKNSKTMMTKQILWHIIQYLSIAAFMFGMLWSALQLNKLPKRYCFYNLFIYLTRGKKKILVELVKRDKYYYLGFLIIFLSCLSSNLGLLSELYDNTLLQKSFSLNTGIMGFIVGGYIVFKSMKGKINFIK